MELKGNKKSIDKDKNNSNLNPIKQLLSNKTVNNEN